MTKKSRDRRVSVRLIQRQRRLIREVFKSEFRKHPLTYDDVYSQCYNPETKEGVLFEGKFYEFGSIEYNNLLNPQFANQESKTIR